MLMSNRQETSEDQPFFKISSHSKTGSQQQGFFLVSKQPATKESSSAVSMFQDPTPAIHQGKQHSQFQHPAPSVTTQSNYQAPQTRHQQRTGSQVVQRERIAEASNHNSEKLTTLHSRLHQEAEKIRRWKVQTEIELKQQEQKLRDSLHTIESQRQSLLELQLQNETLSAKLKEEIDVRSEMEEKIEATRDLCAVVKDYSVRLEEKLTVCEQDRDDIQESQKKCQEDFVVLSNKFEELSIAHGTKVKQLEALIDDERTKTTQAEVNHQESISALDNEIKVLQDDCRLKEENLSQLAFELKEKAASLNATVKEKESIQAFLDKSEGSLGQYKQQIDKLNDELTELQGQLAQSKHEKETLCVTIEEKEKDKMELDGIISKQMEDVTKLSEARDKMIDDCNQLKETVIAKEILCAELKDKLIQLEETSKLSIEKRDEKLSKLEDENQKLVKNVENLEKQMKEVLEEKDHLLLNIEEGIQLASKKESDIAALKDELKDALEREKDSYDKLDLMKKDVEKARSENSALKTEKLAIESHNSNLTQKQKIIEKKSSELAKELKIATDDLAAHKKQLEEMNSLRAELLEKIETLSLEKEEQIVTNQREKANTECQIQKLEGTVLDLEKKLSSMEDKNKSLHGQISQKTKQIKEQQQECKSMKAKNTVQTKQSTKLQKEFETLNNKIVQQRELTQKQTEELEETKLTIKAKDNEITELQKNMAKLREESEKSVKEHDAAKAACEQQMKEVGATLEKYKSENQKIVAQKDKEIEKLQTQLMKKSATKKAEEETLTKQAEAEKRNLKNLVEKLKKEKERLQQDGQALKSKMDEMMKKIKEQENLFTTQKKELEGLKKSQISSSEAARVPMEKNELSIESGKDKPVTPKTPLSVRPVKTTPKLKTPSHGILKSGDSASAKKRSRVMFAQDKGKDKEKDNGTDSDSSTSQLMEIEMDELPFPPLRGNTKQKQIPRQTVTPLRVRPSPCAYGESPPMDLSPLMEQNLEDTAEKENSRTKQSMVQGDAGNTRKTPKKAFRVKSWGDSPYRKKKKKITPTKLTKAKKQDISWFESDAVFGFFE